MSINSEALQRKLYDLLDNKGYNPKPMDATGKITPVPEEAAVIRFDFIKDGENYGKVWISIDGSKKLKIYYGDNVSDSPSDNTSGTPYSDSWTALINHLKNWAQRRQLSFELRNENHLEADMAQREHMDKKERVSEGYYPMGKSASYSDAVPSVKIVIEHSRKIEEGEQRYRNINRIFVENANGERFLLNTTKPGIARVYARHIAEGGTPYDDRGQHIKGIVEEYSKMAGFVRATRNGQFNESSQRLITEGINHYNSLRETLSRMSGKRGYEAYFESWTPSLMEDESDMTAVNELFVQETVDPRIESAMPILAKLSKNISEMAEIRELSEWADSLLEGGDGGEASEETDGDTDGDAGAGGAEDVDDDITESTGDETLAHNERTVKGNLSAFDLEEGDGGQEALNPQGIPEGMLDGSDDVDSPVASAILRRILMQRLDLLSKYGPKKVSNAIGDVADFVGDVDEIGSSDVSGWIKQVEMGLGGMAESDEPEAYDEFASDTFSDDNPEDEIDEGIIDKIKDVGQKALDTLGHGSDEDLLRDLKKKAGVRNPQNGKPSMAHSEVEKVDEVDMGQADSSLRSEPKQNNDKMDHFTALGKASKKMGHAHYMDVPDDKLEALKAMVKRFRAGEEVEESALQAYLGDKKYGKDGMDALRKAGQEDASEKTMQNIRAEYSDKEQGVAEGEFAGDYATGEAGQWRNKGPKANKPATIGDLVGENFINTDAQAVVSEEDSEDINEAQDDLAAMMRIINR
jgi:hypothetical protein